MNIESRNINCFILLLCSNRVPINEISMYLKYYQSIRKFLVSLLRHLLWREKKNSKFRSLVNNYNIK